MPEDSIVIIGGQELDLDRLTATYTDIPEACEVHLPIGPGEVAKLTFKPLPRRSETDQMVRAHSEFYRKLKKAANHPWYAFWPETAQEYIDAAVLSELSVEPKLPIETTLKWQRNAAMVRAIMEQIEIQSKTVATQWIIAMTEEKKSDS